MANVNSLMTNSSSNMSSLYGTRNVLSGLASGLDTESMIENSVSGYKTKITQLEQQQTKYQWKQDAYRSITDKIYDLTQKYTSYTSKTNLYSNAFFNSSISTTTAGTYADKISATGRSTSDIQILAAEAASAARYEVSAATLWPGASNDIISKSDMDLGTEVSVGKLSGTLTLNYDGQKIDITFDESDNDIDSSNRTLAKAIQDKLDEATVTTKNGTKKAGDVIKVSMDGNGLKFTENAEVNKQGATPYISYMDSNLKEALGATQTELYSGSSDRQYTLSKANDNFTGSKTAAEYLASKDINVTVDGITKSFRLDKDLVDSGDIKGAFEKGLKSVGADIEIDDTVTDKLKFIAKNQSSQFSISVSDKEANARLGFGDDGISNYLSEKTSIGTLLGDSFFTDSAANAGANVNADGKYELKINGKSIYVSKDDSLESVLNSINDSDMGVTASYSKLSGSFVFTAKETGASGKISFDNDLAQKLFTGDTDDAVSKQIQTDNTKAGTDAAVRALVNDSLVTLVRASNTFDMDGMTVTLKGNFNEGNITKVNGQVDIHSQNAVTSAEKADAVSFSTSAGSDELIKTIKEFVDEYNAIMKEVHDAYATQPAEKSAKNHTRYEPLTDDDKQGMSDKAIENYEAKAKQGILFGDSDLRSLYEKMVRIISPGGNDGAALRNIGIETTYSGGLTQIQLNEDKLRDALSKDPDSVRNAFTKSKETGASSDGLMTSIKTTMEQYGSTSYASPGILVKKAGSTHNSTSLLNNEVQKQLDNVQTKIEQWQTKMSSKIDYYTRQFTALEKMMNTMNSQSSALSGLMGG